MKPGRHFPLILVLLAGCARSEDASVVADANQVVEVEQVRSPEQDDEAIAIGEWRESIQGEDTALEFGPSGAPALFSLRCDERRSIYLQRHGAVPSGDLPTMLVSIGSETRRLAVTSAGGAVPMLRASLAPSDTLVGTFASATDPIVIRVGDAPLVLPPSPAIGSFLSRCASGVRLEADGNVQSEAADGNVQSEAAAPETEPAAPADR